MAVPCNAHQFRTTVRRKDPIMITLLVIAGIGYGGWRLTCAALRSLRGIPRSNRDMVFF